MVSRDARERETARRARRLADEIRSANDLNFAWPVEDLADLLLVDAKPDETVCGTQQGGGVGFDTRQCTRVNSA